MRGLIVLMMSVVICVGLATYALASETGLLLVRSTPESTVVVDGRELGMTPLEMELPAGEHRIEVEAEGKRRSFTRSINPGKRTSIIIRW